MGNWKKTTIIGLVAVFAYGGALSLSKFVGCDVCVQVLTAGQQFVPHDTAAEPLPL